MLNLDFEAEIEDGSPINPIYGHVPRRPVGGAAAPTARHQQLFARCHLLQLLGPSAQELQKLRPKGFDSIFWALILALVHGNASSNGFSLHFQHRVHHLIFKSPSISAPLW